MGEWFYGSGSIVFENQVEDDYFLIEDIISRYVNNRFFHNTTFSYIREVSDLKPFQTRKEKKENIEPMGYGFKRNASEREPLKIKGIKYINKMFVFLYKYIVFIDKLCPLCYPLF